MAAWVYQLMSGRVVSNSPNGICFIGAMNRDYVCLSRLDSNIRDMVLASRPGKSVDFSETAISEDENSEILHHLPQDSCRSELGGSGFNAIRSAALLGALLRLGFVGVVGHVDGTYPHWNFLNEKNIEVDFLKKENRPCANSMSFSYDGDRTLLTTTGANSLAAEYFDIKRYEISEYLSTFSKVHVTSFLDVKTTEKLAELIELTLQKDVPLRISVDPGAVWVNNLSDAAKRVIATASLLHLNEREFAVLGGRLRDEREKSVAERIARMMRDGEKTIVLRKHKSVTVFNMSSGRMNSFVVENHHLLSDSAVVDPTGAGDTLTGLLLAISESEIMTTSLAASLAMSATVEKLKHPGAIQEEDLSRAFSKKLGPLNLSLGQKTSGHEGLSDE
ncbi:carbohydrate kinase family protein [Roseibium litorale]|uniref:Carbohydrate kinase family protein n=1 Tax=Roseibium litorale TaxID=2803841 RepID=A0ABR9CU11_9HYPH|nr:carbohydrate kinase family protein [Roseibium litorale]MBD8894119.1 carbohydrate kinase family protein [Roseibium litorale]